MNNLKIMNNYLLYGCVALFMFCIFITLFYIPYKLVEIISCNFMY